MPRITAAQLSYGSVTVVFSTLAMLLLSRTDSGLGVAVIGTAALALGLLVAVTVPHPSRAKTAKSAKARAAARTNHDPVSAAVEAEGLARDGARAPIPQARTAGQRAAARVDELLGEHSLRS
ncbi:hypothetical protein [Streptomyces sp. NBC_01618]|uniref:hypothetical protein n=1 Tax=Streptomyces sp. NBC_01618 TaxID=2975900 RepID=UPI0038693701|nr:hypothetical protein OH735_13605 [Streptomyces sp. NBC_01618]